MKKILKIIIVSSGVFFTLNGFIVSLFSNFNLGNILCVGLGVALIWIGLADKIHPDFSDTSFYIFIKRTLSVLCAVAVLMSVFLNVYGIYDNCDYTEDAIIVLGAAVHGDKVSQTLAFRLDSAVNYCHKNPRAVVVVSGGRGFQEDIAEAEAMKNYLIKRGISSEKIICEDKATSTYENFTFSADILNRMFPGGYRAVLSTNDFHVFRAERIARECDLDISHVGAPLTWYNIAPCTFRECLAVAKNLVFGG